MRSRPPGRRWRSSASWRRSGTWSAGHFGYREEAPTLKNLLIRLLVSDLAHACRAPLPDGLKHLTLPRQGAANAVVCLAQWRDSSTRGPSYETLSAGVADAVKLAAAPGGLGDRGPDGGQDLPAGREDHRQPSARPGAGDRGDASSPRSSAPSPPAGRTATGPRRGCPTPRRAPRRALYAVYQALQTAADLFALRNEQVGGLGAPGREGAARAPTPAACIASISSIATSARPRISPSRATGTSSSPCARRSSRSTATASWRSWRWSGTSIWRPACSGCGGSTGFPTSRHSTSGKSRRVLAKGADRRVFVIISDAFRYEAAQELTDAAQRQVPLRGGAVRAAWRAAVLHGAGHGRLLPHQTLDYNESGDIRVDGKPCGSLEQRGKVLEAVQGVAVKADDLHGDEEGRGPGVRQAVPGRLRLSQPGRCGRRQRRDRGEDLRGRAQGHRRTGRPGGLHRQQPQRQSRASSPPTTASCSRKRRPARPTRAAWPTSRPAP